MNMLSRRFFRNSESYAQGYPQKMGGVNFYARVFMERSFVGFLGFVTKRPLQATISTLSEGNGADDGMLGLKVCTRHHSNTSQIETACTSGLVPELCSRSMEFLCCEFTEAF